MELTLNSTTVRVPSLPIIKSDARDRSLCSLSVVLCNKFVQISSSPTRFRTNKNSLFKVLFTENNKVQVVEGRCNEGYLNDENATKTTIDEEGWLHIGDVVGYIDDNDEIFIVDRVKKLIKFKGLQ
ncbi:hypothetical protein RYX36_005084, partial [Vicia faba]